MSQPIYPDQLVERLAAEWKPPHRRPLPPEKPSGIPIRQDVLRAVLDSAFFMSLRTEEGHHYDLALVLVSNPRQLTELRPPWRVHPLGSPLTFEADRLTKLAPALQGGKRFLVVQIDDIAPMIVGVGDAPEASWFLTEDQYPRVRVIGPGDMVFYRGDSAVFRYRAGRVDELRPDFFTSRDEPADAMRRIGQRLFDHWETPEQQSVNDIVARYLSNLIEHIAQIGHGGMLAVLAPDEALSEELRNACSYQIAPLELGKSLVSDYEGAMVASQIDQRIMGPPPDYAPRRALTTEELDQEADWREAQDAAESHSRTVAGMAAVDGAVLLTHELKVLGFGCKLPGLNGPAPRVLRAPDSPNDKPAEYDLTMRGTRHTSAALFAETRPGRMALTVSADGPAACFTWSPRHNAVVHWPVHVGAFAPRGLW